MKNQWPLEKEKTGFDPLGEYDRLMGEKCREASAWRFRTLLTMVANIILLVITGVSLTTNKTVPVFIMENELGELTYLGKYSKDYAAGKVTEKMIQAHIRQFITNMFSIPTDSEVLRNNIMFCYAALTKDSASKFTRFQKEDNPFDNFGMRVRRVQIESILALSDSSYQVDFWVTETLPDGSSEKVLKKRSVLTTTLMQPSEDDTNFNPAGIYIINFDVTNL